MSRPRRPLHARRPHPDRAARGLATCFGGAEATVAVALSHFGVRCDYVTRVPDNPIGDAGVAALAREGVGTEWIARGGERLGIYFVEPGADLRTMRVVYDRAGSAFARIEPRAIDWPRVLAGADWFHASGITPALGDGTAGAPCCTTRRPAPSPRADGTAWRSWTGWAGVTVSPRPSSHGCWEETRPPRPSSSR